MCGPRRRTKSSPRCSSRSTAAPDAENAENDYHEALTLAEELAMRPLVAHCHLGLGKLSRRTGKRQEAREHLARVTTMYREMDMRFRLERAEAELAARG